MGICIRCQHEFMDDENWREGTEAILFCGGDHCDLEVFTDDEDDVDELCEDALLDHDEGWMVDLYDTIERTTDDEQDDDY